MSAPEPLEVAPEPIPLDILYEDRDIIVINKPAGDGGSPRLPGETLPGDNWLMPSWAPLRDLSGIGGKLRPGIVHRLDKDTSGVLVAVKNDYAHKVPGSPTKTADCPAMDTSGFGKGEFQ